MVVLNLPDELAWTISVDWKDFEFIGTDTVLMIILSILEMYGKMFVRDLIRCIPQSGIAKVLAAYLKSELSGFPPDTHETNNHETTKEEPPARVPTEDILDEMIVIALSFCYLMCRRDII
jgi:hypothetical protein